VHPIQNLRRIFFSFVSDGWIELFKLHKKNYVPNLKKIFYKKVQNTIISNIREIDPKL
jgi:hypothetical protein